MSTSTARAVSPDSGLHWAEPGAWPVAPGVHRIPLPLPMDGLRAVNVYAIETESGLTLVDGGWAIEVSRDLLERSLKEVGHSPSDIRSFLVTHVHRDHYTQAVVLGREVGATVHLGAGERRSLEDLHDPTPREDSHVSMLRRAGADELADQWEADVRDREVDLSMWGFPDEWIDGDQTIEVGSRTLDAVSTPGHTQGHFVFAEREAGLLFAGDHVLPTITPSIGFESSVADQPLGDFLGSLARVRAMPDLRLLPAHGPVAPSAHARIDELVSHHDHRLELCRQALAGPGLTSYDVARALPWTRHDHAFDTLDVFNAALATMETRAHLQLLLARGEATAALSSEGHDIYTLTRGS